MKAIISAALVLGLCGLARAENKADPIGTWKCEYEVGGPKRKAELVVTEDKTSKDKFAGVMNWPDQKDVKVKDLKFKDGELTFSAVRKFMDNEITIEYKLKVEGDKIKGKASAEVGGNKQEFDVEGKREKKDK